MTNEELEICKQLYEEAELFSKSGARNQEFANELAKDDVDRKIERMLGNKKISYAEGIMKALTSLGYNNYEESMTE